MHAHLINYAFYSLSLNTIDNSLGNWIYTSLIITYCTNKRGFFSRRFFPRCFSLSLSIFPSFSSPFLWRALPTIYPSFKANITNIFYIVLFNILWSHIRLSTNRSGNLSGPRHLSSTTFLSQIISLHSVDTYRRQYSAITLQLIEPDAAASIRQQNNDFFRPHFLVY